jgi:hypothetical protein
MVMSMTDLEAATKIVADLETKLIRLKQRGVELGDERQSIALAAHTGDGQARKRLDAVNQEIATHHSEVDGLCSAIEAAKLRVDQAKAAEQRAAAAVDADNLKKIIRHRKKIAAEFDAHMAKATQLLADYKQTCEAASALAPVPPTAMQMLTFVEQVVHGYFMNTFVKRGFRVLTQRERMTLTQLDAGWSDPTLARLDAATKPREPADAA